MAGQAKRENAELLPYIEANGELTSGEIADLMRAEGKWLHLSREALAARIKRTRSGYIKVYRVFYGDKELRGVMIGDTVRIVE